MTDWMNQSWPLNSLPAFIQQYLADNLDVITATGLGYPRFASNLSIGGYSIYTSHDIALIVARSQPGSVTTAFLQDYERRGGTVQGVQHALEVIGHIAAGIIPAYLERLGISPATSYPRQYTGNNEGYPAPFHSGSQQTERPNCNCPQCQGLSSYSNASNRSMTERSVPNGSVFTRSSGTRRRPSNRENGVTPSRSTTSCTNPSSLTSPGTNDSYSQQGIPVYVPLPNMGDSVDRLRNPNNMVVTGEINNGYCSCENCRLRSDPEQTQRLTLESDPKAQCLHKQERRTTANAGYGYDIASNPSTYSEGISNGISQLYLDSEESGDTSVANVENFDETFEKSVFSDSEMVNNEGNLISRGINTGPVKTNNRRPICSRSNIGEHRLGERVSDCTVCRNFTGAIPKNSARQRNSSDPQTTVATETDLRRSWHGPSENSAEEEIRKSMSDSMLSVPKSSVTDLPQQHQSPMIEETIYSRISSGESFAENRTHGVSSRSVDSTHSGINSARDIYQNNLESGDADALTSQQSGGRNIVQSDSSNCLEQRTQAPGDANNRPSRNIYSCDSSEPLNGASFEPMVQISNDYAQTGNLSDEHFQQRGGPAPSAQQNRLSLATAQPNCGSGGDAQHNFRSGRSAQQSSRLGGSAQQKSISEASALQNNETAAGTQNNQDRRSGDFVLVTYSWNGMTDPESFIQEVINMCLALREAGIRVKIDMDDESYATLRLNKLDWIDRNVREAKYVIVCISPTYAADIREPDPINQARNQASPRSGQLNARYIFDKLREEYYSNSSQNRRTIPVMFSNYGTTDQHVPSCMRSTLIYRYPETVEQIVAAILGFGRFKPS